MDLVVRNARIRGMDGVYDIGVENGKIVRIEKEIAEKGEEEIDAKGKLVVPAFANMHFHLDGVLTLGKPRFNESGTLLEGIEIWAEYKRKLLNEEEMLKRVEKAVKWMVCYGTLYLRTHADTTEKTLTTVKGLVKAKEMFKEIMDIQVTAFPQDGILTERDNLELLEKAMEIGADCVGMIPHNELTREDGVKSVEIAFEIAKKYDRDVDGHVDETDDPNSRFLEVVAKETIRNDYQWRVVAGHCTAMHSYDNAYAFKLMKILKRAGITIVANPLINIHLQGRFDSYPKRRGLTRIKELMREGINVCLGHDCIMDPWYPLGVGDMLQALFMAVHVGHMMGYGELIESFDLITTNAAKALRLKDYGVDVGCRADFLVLNAYNEIDALRLLGPPLYVIRNGKIVAKNVGGESWIRFRGRWERVEFFE